jgi:prefoldin subunit 5
LSAKSSNNDERVDTATTDEPSAESIDQLEATVIHLRESIDQLKATVIHLRESINHLKELTK